MTTYPITREQFEAVRPLLEDSRKKTRPRIHDLYDVLCAILLREQGKLPWRSLPPGFPPWRTVHEYHLQWSMSKPGTEPVLSQVYRILDDVWPAEEAA